MVKIFNALSIILVTSLFFLCSEEKIPSRFYPRNDHEAYWHSLEQANLLTTALGKEWNRAAENALESPVEVRLPYQEAFHFDPRVAESLAYRFEVKRGQKILIHLNQIEMDSAYIFMDAYRVVNDSLKEYRQIASADSSFQLAFEPRQDAEYLLRLQPELLRGGNFRIEISQVPALEFPVAGKNKRAIQSRFGAPRDGGRREHHGVDIFAKRHTPIIAPCKGYVRFVGERGIGGNVIWIYDNQRNQSLYFAHLQSQLVTSRTYVSKGDTIGTVGNSGNARTTPPHLHFGIYKNGPIDPYYFVSDMGKNSLEFLPYTEVLGQSRPVLANASLRIGNSRKSAVIDTVEHNENVNITAITDNYLRVATSTGTRGYMDPKDVSIHITPER